MKLKRENGYWSLAPSTLGDRLRSSSFLKKHGKTFLIVFVIVWFFVWGYFFTTYGFFEDYFWLVQYLIGIFVGFGIPLIIAGLLCRVVYGCFLGRSPKEVEKEK